MDNPLGMAHHTDVYLHFDQLWIFLVFIFFKKKFPLGDVGATLSYEYKEKYS